MIKKDSKEVYNMRKKLIAVEEEQIKEMEQLTKRKQFDSKRKKRTFKTISYKNVTM